MKYNIPDRVMRDITSFSKEYNIRKVVLFGSRARGTHTDRSDELKRKIEKDGVVIYEQTR